MVKMILSVVLAGGFALALTCAGVAAVLCSVHSAAWCLAEAAVLWVCGLWAALFGCMLLVNVWEAVEASVRARRPRLDLVWRV